jgi:hypothetical protein
MKANKKKIYPARIIIYLFIIIVTLYSTLAQTYLLNSTNDWSGTQGTNNIRYLAINNTIYYDLGLYSSATTMWSDGGQTQINRSGFGSTGHSGGLANPSVALRWTVESGGLYNLTFRLKRVTNETGGIPSTDGFNITILNHTNQTIANLPISNLENTSVKELNTLTNLVSGQSIYYVIYSNVSSYYDTFSNVEMLAFLPNANYTITAYDQYDGTQIDNFSVQVNNTNYSTSTGTITTIIPNNLSKLTNITFLNANNTLGRYFNKTYQNINVSTGTLTATLYQVEAKMNATEILSINLITGMFYTPITSTSEIFYLKSGSYNITFVNSSYDNKTQEFSFTALQNVTRTVENISSTSLNITAQNITGNTTINIFNGWVAYQNGLYNTSFSTSTGSAIVTTLRNQNYTVFINATDHATVPLTSYKTINTTYSKNNITFYLLPDKSFEARIKDTTTNNDINGALLTLYGSLNTYNYTINGKTFQQNLTTDSYNYVLTLAGYTTVTGTILINPQAFYNTTIYMINSTQSTTTAVTVFVRNIQNQYLSNASVTIIRDYDGAIVSQKYTDNSGGVVFNLDNNLNYHINITLAGFQNYYDSFNLVDTTYTITLTAIQNVIPSLYAGINISWLPTTNTQINNNSNINLGFYYNSTGYWAITNCYMTSYTEQSSTTIILATNNSGSCTALNGNIFTTINSHNYTFVESLITLTMNATYNISYKQRWGLGYYYVGDASIKTALDNFKLFNKAGFGNFERYAAVFLVILSIVLGVASANEAFNVSTRTFFLLWALIGVASIVDLLSLPFGIPFIKQWGVFVLITMLLIVIVIQKKEFTD